eukprot:7360890-Pyramimonas_sp.AAC.1
MRAWLQLPWVLSLTQSPAKKQLSKSAARVRGRNWYEPAWGVTRGVSAVLAGFLQGVNGVSAGCLQGIGSYQG